MFFQKIRKLTIGFVLSLFVFSSLVGFFVSAEPAAAIPTEVLGDLPAQAKTIVDMVKNGWKIAVLNAAQQSVSYFLRKVAYDSAVWLASGGKGQSPFAHTKGFGSYMASVGSDAAGTAIEQLGKGFGLDLCKIPDVKIDLALRIGLHYNYALGSEPRKPACNLATFQENWSGDAWASKYGDGKGGFDVNKVFNKSITVDDAPLGIAYKTTEKIDRLVAKQTDSAKADRVESQGYKAATRLISGEVKTPSQVIKKEAEANSPSEQNKKSETQIAAAMGSGAYEIIPSTLSLFLNTLAGTMLKNFKENGMLPGGLCVGPYGDPSCRSNGQAGSYDAGSPPTGRAVAEAAFSEFLTTKLDALSNYDILAELNSCEARGLYNCRADQGLVQAIQEAKQGQPVTIKEAIDKGWLHGNWKLIPPARVADNTDQNCYNNNYCYSNLQVLRQLRIFPLGLEIAAKNSDQDHPATLNDVVNGFYDCNYVKDAAGNVVGINYDPENKPFCHLVDPNWVIKLAQTRCDAMAYGSTPLSTDVPDRIKECVDLKTCVGTDKDGNCAGYGNCVREKNVWKFDADKCDAQFATCRLFTDSAGQSVSYLYRTLDSGDCSQDTAGCTAYSLQQGSAGWQTVAPTNYGNYSTGIYLNKNVSTACSANSEGCSAFRLAGETNLNSIIPLKKAPDYLNCYDSDANASNGIQWPQTFSDIFKMQPKAECKNFAQACIADEVGCANFSLANDPGATPVPGKFTPASVSTSSVLAWNDQCDGRCAGYAAYREMPSNYSVGTPLAYIIPPSKYNDNQSGKICKAEEKGCSSFTNMSDTTGDGEKVEYFTDLRTCIKPNPAQQKNFYTYEGSEVGGAGYQLQVYTLKKNTIDDEDLATPGVQTGNKPETVFNTILEKIEADTYKCNATLYKAGQADPDCRQFNDDKGNISYALLSHTVAVSPDCTSYRLNSAELAGANQCFGNGEYKDGACYYDGLPTGVTTNVGSSKTCSAQAVSCREYKGNNGNNTKTIGTIDTFESKTSVTTENGWNKNAGNVSWSNESTRSGEHSLGFTGANGNTVYKSLVLKSDALDTQSNMSYSLSFWAKGSGVNVGVSMTDGAGSLVSAGTITANTSWQYYTFNLVELQSSGTSSINFNLKSNGSLFLDNVRLTKVAGFLYLVKDSLKVDPVCDDNLSDNLPGAALGCSAYVGPTNSLGDKLYYLTNFSFLCREGAIGCTAFTDTYNKISDTGPRAYNVSLVGPTGAKATAKIGNDSYSCQIEQGKTNCYVNVTGHTKAEILAATGVGVTAQFVASTYYVPADTSSTAPIYLVAKNEQTDYTCSSADIGCTAAGLQKSTPTGNQFVTMTIKLDPNLLDSNGATPGILCRQESEGCGIYGSSLGDAYFKDPAVTGAKICTYQTGVLKNNNKVNGWFWKGTGVCGSTSTLEVTLPKTTCVSDGDCAVGGCIEKDVQPCYPDYLQNGNSYGLWSFGNQGKYENFVGECPAEQNACTEFVDHNDKDAAYYFLKNNKISEGDCGGMASQKAGCAIFDQTDNPNKSWNTAATYMLSDSFVPGKNTDLSKVTKVQPVDQGAKNDANILIKVNRDRECAEWLQCSQSHMVWDDRLAKLKPVCDRIGRCDSLPSDKQTNNTLNCGEFIDGDHELSGKLLTEEVYINRDITWKGKDFDGFSLLGAYPLEELSQFNVSADETAVWRLAKAIPCGGNNCPTNPINAFACASTSTPPLACGKNNEGLCVNQICLQGPYGGHKDLVNIDSPDQICRAYPEKDSPFSNSTFTDTQIFANVNKCGENIKATTDLAWANKCECDYTKVTFGDGVIKKYWDYLKPNSGPDAIKLNNQLVGVPSGICSGGLQDGKYCNADDDCRISALGALDPSSTGICQKQKQNVKFIGWRGYCLEKDFSRFINGKQDDFPCLSWLPVDSLAGSKDINNQHAEAGFIPPVDTKYCLAAEIFKQPAEYGRCIDPPGVASCSESDCSNLAVNFCPSGYHMASGRRGVDGGYCGGTSYGGKEDDCQHWNQNDCNFQCVPDGSDENKNNSTKWIPKGNFPAKNTQVGCLVGAGIDVNSVGWTNRLWKESGYKIDTTNFPNFNNKLNYAYFSTTSPFAYTPDPFNNLIVLSSCRSGQDYSMPNTDGSCDQGSTKVSFVNMNLAYEPWKLIGGTECNNDSSCNQGASCTNHVDTAVCQRICSTDKDCQILGDFGTCNIITKASNVNGVAKPASGMCTKPSANASSCGNVNNCDTQTVNNAIINNGGSVVAKNICVGVCNDKSGPLKNSSCDSDSQCYEQICQNNGIYNECLFKDPSKNPPVAVAVTDKIKNAFKQFQQLFAKISDPISNLKLFSDPIYVPLNQPTLKSDITASATDKSKVPQVHPVGECSVNGNCLEINKDGFTVNGLYDKDVIIESKPYIATARFYMHANSDQMPIKRVTAIWGDSLSVVPVGEGAFRNQRGAIKSGVCKGGTCANLGNNPSDVVCKTDADCAGKFVNICVTDESQASEFGRIVNKTCDNNYFETSHPYICKIGDASWDPKCTGSNGVGNDYMVKAYGGCCVYQPKIQVKDNWGWCNGVCPNGADGTDGCYDGKTVNGFQINECSPSNITNNNKSYTNFGAKILVAPNNVVLSTSTP